MRRTMIAWIAGTAIGASLIALPDPDARLVNLSEAHGPGPLDAAGAVLVTVASVIAWWHIWRRRRALRGTPRISRYGLCAATGLGAGLITASVFGDFSAWWAIGAGLLTAVQAGLLIAVGVDVQLLPVRTRVTGYVTRGLGDEQHLLVFDYLTDPDAGTQLPGGGVEEGELLGDAIQREVREETGVLGDLAVHSVVGAQRSRYSDTGRRYVNVFFHLVSTDDRDEWEHVVHGDPTAWDTGLAVRCRFLPVSQARKELQAAGHGQDQFIPLLGGQT